MPRNPLLRFTPQGIYCKQADIYIDPWKPVRRAIITHGHADHARRGNGAYLAHRFTCEILRVRLGPADYVSFEYGDSVLINGVRFSFYPAGHLLGSAQIRVEYKGEVWVVTGDYKVENDGLCEPWEPLQCHTLITECTFGLPVYHWKAQDEVRGEMTEWISRNREAGKNSILLGYSLGKAQRILHMLSHETDPIYCHGAVENMNEVHRRCGLILPPTLRVSDEKAKKKPENAIVVAPPSAIGTPWLNRFRPYATAMASGWMTLRGARRRRAADKGLVLSDHVDWPGLHEVMSLCKPEQVICTHGYTEIFADYLRSRGMNAHAEKTFFDAENDEE